MQRRALDHAISTITFDLRRLADRVEEQTAGGVDALVMDDPGLAKRMQAWSEGDRRLHRKIEHEGLAAIATHQPAARDLRAVLAALHMAQELARMAEHASDIARIAIMRQGMTGPPIPPAIPQMQAAVCAMLRRAMHAYVEHDAALAIATVSLDEEVDALHVQTLRVMLTYMMQDRRLVTGATHLVWVARALERIGDRATNMCERVLFAERGDLISLKHKGVAVSDPGEPSGMDQHARNPNLNFS
jgi:phosphate transport system protein